MSYLNGFLMFNILIAINQCEAAIQQKYPILYDRFGGFWPKPHYAALSTKTIQIYPPSIRYNLENVPKETRWLVDKITYETNINLRAECGGAVSRIGEKPVTVIFNVTSSDLRLDWNTNEEYKLDVKKIGNNESLSVFITAETVYGARHALETLTQMTSAVKMKDNQCALFILSGAKIQDEPAYSYRGLMLDTARHFIPMAGIKRTMDGMAASKMNVFHWHVTDTQSFPLESTRVPQLTRFGAFSESEVYTDKDVREIVRYAQIRGIRVVIEIDSPGHAGKGWQWGPDAGLGELEVCLNVTEWQSICLQPPCGQLNPINPLLYKVLRKLYKDIVEYLPKPTLFHMGGDEVSFRCWESIEPIKTYMMTKKTTNDIESGFRKVWAQFHAKALSIWDEEYVVSGGDHSPPVMVWSSELTHMGWIHEYLDSERFVIQMWSPAANTSLAELMILGYRLVSSPMDVWYLDWETTWYKMYSHTLPKDPKMLGGEACMWTERVFAENLDRRIWPRAAAVAERLWSDPKSPASDAEVRLQRHRGRLQARGLNPDLLTSELCGKQDLLCQNMEYDSFEYQDMLSA